MNINIFIGLFQEHTANFVSLIKKIAFHKV